MMKTKNDTIPLSRIRRMGPCSEQMDIVERLYPDGVPVTWDAIGVLRDAKVDVIWAGVRLLTKAQRQAFILFTLRQRQPHIAALFERLGLPDHAEAIRGLQCETVDDLEEVYRVYDAAYGAVALGDLDYDASAANAARGACAAAYAYDDNTAAYAAAYDAREVNATYGASIEEQIAWIAQRLGFGTRPI